MPGIRADGSSYRYPWEMGLSSDDPRAVAERLGGSPAAAPRDAGSANAWGAPPVDNDPGGFRLRLWNPQSGYMFSGRIPAGSFAAPPGAAPIPPTRDRLLAAAERYRRGA